MKRILLVEDEGDLRALLTKMIERGGYEVVQACDGNEAEAILRNESVDLIISDLVMPGKDGIELLMDIRRKLPDIKIIAMSGGGHTGTGTYLTVARALGANITLNKPFEGKCLLDAIERELAA